METGHIVLVITTVLTGLFGWGANHISNAPKKEDASMNKINLIITQYESFNAVITQDNIKLRKENRELHEKVTTLEERIRNLERGE